MMYQTGGNVPVAPSMSVPKAMKTSPPRSLPSRIGPDLVAHGHKFR